MPRAGQTPHGARPNREEVRGFDFRIRAADTCRLGASNLRVGRLSRAVMRGPEEWSSRRSNPADRIRLTGPAATNKALHPPSGGCAVAEPLAFRQLAPVSRLGGILSVWGYYANHLLEALPTPFSEPRNEPTAFASRLFPATAINEHKTDTYLARVKFTLISFPLPRVSPC